MRVAVPARAKLNLDLQVVRRRDDGYHEVRTHMQAVDLHDLVEAAIAATTTLQVTGFEVPKTADNIVIKAHQAIEEAARRKLPTEFRLHKRIPPGAGLGGASSDAAAALRALKVVHALQDIDLMPIARAIGADVPFFMVGGAVLAEGAGDRMTPRHTEPKWFVIAWPGIELSTAAVYGAWDEVMGEPPNELLRAAGHVDKRVHDFAQRLGHRWQMTGSGSAFFRICANRDEAHQVAKTTQVKLDCWTRVTHSMGAWS